MGLWGVSERKNHQTLDFCLHLSPSHALYFSFCVSLFHSIPPCLPPSAPLFSLSFPLYLSLQPTTLPSSALILDVRSKTVSRQRRSLSLLLCLCLSLMTSDLPLQVLPQKQHGDRDAVLRRGRPGAPEREPDLPAAAEHRGGGRPARHEGL